MPSGSTQHKKRTFIGRPVGTARGNLTRRSTSSHTLFIVSRSYREIEAPRHDRRPVRCTPKHGGRCHSQGTLEQRARNLHRTARTKRKLGPTAGARQRVWYELLARIRTWHTCAVITASTPSSDGIGGITTPPSSSSSSSSPSTSTWGAASAGFGGGVFAADFPPSTLRLRRFLAIIVMPPITRERWGRGARGWELRPSIACESPGIVLTPGTMAPLSRNVFAGALIVRLP